MDRRSWIREGQGRSMWRLWDTEVGAMPNNKRLSPEIMISVSETDRYKQIDIF